LGTLKRFALPRVAQAHLIMDHIQYGPFFVAPLGSDKSRSRSVSGDPVKGDF